MLEKERTRGECRFAARPQHLDSIAATNGRPQPKDPSVNDRLLTMAEVSEMLRVPIATLRYWRHIGKGPHSFRIGRRVFYRESDVLAWLDHQAGYGCGDDTAA
jgi:predicted DNA-binding transcriptional regulator AlpA